MTAEELLALRKEALALSDERKRLGEFDANAGAISRLAIFSLMILDHLLEKEIERKKK